MDSNPEEWISFYEAHKDTPRYTEIMQKLGYTSQDLSAINLSQIAKESAEFTTSLSYQDRQFYLKKKYQALVLRRMKIVRHVNQEYHIQSEGVKSLGNTSFLTERSYVRQQPELVLTQLNSKQKQFYKNQNNFYNTVSRIRQKRLLYNRNVQDNQLANCEHYKLLFEKHDSLSSGSERKLSMRTQFNPNEQKRKKVYQSFLNLRQEESSHKRSQLSIKLSKDKEKVEKIHKNLRQISLQRKSRAKKLFDQIARNKQVVFQTIQQDIQDKHMRLSQHMKKFQQNRSVRLSQRDQKLELQKSLFCEREKQAEHYFKNVVEKQREATSKELQQRLQKAKQNKMAVVREMLQSMKQQAVLSKKKELSVNKLKRQKQRQKQIKNHLEYKMYNKHLNQVLDTKDKNIKLVKTKLLEQKIKQQIAVKNMEILKRQQMHKMKKVKKHLQQKLSTAETIQKAKQKLVVDRREFLSRTAKKLQRIQLDFNKTISNQRADTLEASRGRTASSRFNPRVRARDIRTAQTPDAYA